MIDFIFVLAFYVLIPIAVVYFVFMLLTFITSLLEISMTFIIPIIIVVLICSTFSFIRNNNSMDKGKKYRILVRRIVFCCCGVAFLFFTVTQTNSFKEKLQGKALTCSYDELGYLGFINYTYETISFDDSEKCKLYRYKREGIIEDEKKELPGEYIGDYKYTLIRLINGNYFVVVNRHIYSIKAKNNNPKWLSYRMRSVF